MLCATFLIHNFPSCITGSRFVIFFSYVLHAKHSETNCRSPLPHVNVFSRTCILPSHLEEKFPGQSCLLHHLLPLCVQQSSICMRFFLKKIERYFTRCCSWGDRPSCVTSEVPYLLVSSIFVKKEKENFMYVLVFNIFVEQVPLIPSECNATLEALFQAP